MAGLTPTGFDKKTQDDCLQEMKTDAWATISKGLNLASVAPLGQVFGIFSERLGTVWDALEAVHAARDPKQASASALKAVCAITGTKARSATTTLVPGCIVNVDAGFDALPGTMVAALDTDATALFTNVSEVKNTGGAPADFPADFRAVNPGALPALAGHLVVKSQSLSGWNSITNPVDGEEGLDDDSDVTLRQRRDDELEIGGSSTTDAIRSDILNNLKSNITNCKVIPNETDVVDANGLPPHSFEVIARGQATDMNASIALAKQILASKDGGDRAHGTDSQVIVDGDGNSHVIGYTWVSDQNVWFIVNVTILPESFPVDGDAQIINAILAVGAAYDPGVHVVAKKIEAACFTVDGVDDVPSLLLGFAATPTGTANLPIDIRSIAKFDSSRIIVNHV